MTDPGMIRFSSSFYGGKGFAIFILLKLSFNELEIG
jgi:hypothetical protein